MKVEIEKDKHTLTFIFTLEDNDIEKPSEKFSMGRKKTVLRTLEHDLEDVHPDLLALSAVLICNPFVGEILKFDFSPSREFMDGANSILSRYKLTSICDEPPAEKRAVVSRPSPGLAFSGGVDSTAAICVMPGSTIPVFMDRPLSSGSLYNPDAAHQSCSKLKELGYEVQIIECDLEYVREPVGFPTDVANAVPAIILSDHLGLGSISFGTVLESAYGTGHEHFRDYPNGSHWNFYSTLFESAGIPMSLPIAGVSEVGTAIIAHKAPAGLVAQSCIRGKWQEPCMKCWKCFRKGLLANALGHIKLSVKEIEGLIESNEVRTKLSSLPISHENVVAFAMNRSDVTESAEIETLRKRVEGLGKLSLLGKWYSPSIELIPDNWRFECGKKIQRFLGVMNSREEDVIEEWNMDGFLLSEETIQAHRELIEVFS